MPRVHSSAEDPAEVAPGLSSALLLAPLLVLGEAPVLGSPALRHHHPCCFAELHLQLFSPQVRAAPLDRRRVSIFESVGVVDESKTPAKSASFCGSFCSVLLLIVRDLGFLVLILVWFG